MSRIAQSELGLCRISTKQVPYFFFKYFFFGKCKSQNQPCNLTVSMSAFPRG